MSNYQKLSPEEVKEVASDYYQRRVGKTEARAEPVYVLVGAQPGAGKSAAANAVRDGLRAEGGYIHVDADRMRDQIDTRGTKPTSTETQQDAGRLVSELRKLAIEGKRNIVEEGTFRDPATFGTFVNARRAEGYKVEMVAVATPRDESVLGIFQRVEAQHKAGSENPRNVPIDYHDEAMRGFEKTLSEHGDKFSRVRVVNRNGEVLYDTQDAGKDGPRPVQALRAGQVLSDPKLASVGAVWGQLEAQAQARGASKDYLASLVQQRQGIQDEIQARISTHARASFAGHYENLSKNPGFARHEQGELVKAAYFRGVYEKSSEFKGQSPDFKAYDATMASRENARGLPEPPAHHVPEEVKESSRNRSAGDDLSL